MYDVYDDSSGSSKLKLQASYCEKERYGSNRLSHMHGYFARIEQRYLMIFNCKIKKFNLIN